MGNDELISLVKRSQEGDKGAMEELLRVSYTPVSYQCRRFLKTGQDAEDMTQEILLLLYTKLDTLQEPAAYWGWLGRMTANRCKNALTRTHTDLPILEDEEGNSVLDVMENEDRQTVPEEAFDNAETARMIGGIVDALPEAQRQCVLLYYYDEMSVKEIAELLGVSENTIKSRLNYARKAIKENVLDYEKKQGIKLHSLAPIPLLLYFLRMAAEESTDREAAERMAQKVITEGTAAMEQAADGQAAASGSAAGQAATRALQGISVKTAAIAAAGLLLIGGVSVGIMAVVNRDQEEAVETEAPVETEEPDVEADTQGPETEEESVEEAETQEEAFFLTEALAALPYTGDKGQCVMTVAQAEAFADVLDGCITKSMEAGYPQAPFCRAALFDAGDGVPALFVVWGYDMGYGGDSGYMSNVSQIYFWDGGQAQIACESQPQEEYKFSENTSNITVTDNELIMERISWGDGICVEISEVYSLPDGLAGAKPDHVYEEFVFLASDIPMEEECRAGITGQGTFGGDYDFDNLAQDKWEFYPEYSETGGRWREEGGWLAAALDGEFLTTAEVAEKRRAYAWYEAEWKLGHGEKWMTDVSHSWTGDWIDAEELAALLRGNGGAGTADHGDAAEDGFSENAKSSMDGDILRSTLDSKGYDIEIYYEVPVFEESTGGYQKINETFKKLRDEFVDSGEAGPDGLWEIVEANPPVSESYYYTVSAEVTGQTDKYVSVRQTLDMYLGGIGGSETTYYNFRTDTGEGLLLTDLLDGTESRIKRMIAVAVEDTEPSAKGTGALEEILSRDIGDFNYYIKDGKAHVCFEPYEIYGMAYGPEVPIEVELPVWLKAEWE